MGDKRRFGRSFIKMLSPLAVPTGKLSAVMQKSHFFDQ